jgi:diguanylate cyclase (GGDEF)-like protein
MKLFNSLNRLLDRLPRGLLIVVALIVLLIVGVIDYITGEEIGLSIFYVIPVILMAWYLGKTAGIIMSFVAASAWYIADTAAGHVYSNAAIPVWNAVVRLGFFLLIGLFMSILKDVLGHEQDLARTDSLTGVVNSRYFYKLAEVELERAKRYARPFSIAYMDLDNFKEVNDVYGHGAGDELLCFIAGTVRDNIRGSDIVARLGGDEFVLLLPETKDGDAGKVMEKLCSLIREGMPEYHFPVTVSVGVITYLMLPASVEEMIREVDDLMYSVKKSTKNAIKHAIIEDETDSWRMMLDRPGQGHQVLRVLRH